MVRQIDQRIAVGIAGGADPALVAAAIVAAVDDPTGPTRVLVGDDAISAWHAFRAEQLQTWQAELSTG